MGKPLSFGLFVNILLGGTTALLATAPPPGTMYQGTHGTVLYGADGLINVVGSARSVSLTQSIGPIQPYDVSTPLVAVPGSSGARIRLLTKLPGAAAAHPFPVRVSTSTSVTSRTLTTGTQLQALDLSSPVVGVSFVLETDATTGELNLLITFTATGAKRIIIECGGAVVQAAVTVA